MKAKDLAAELLKNPDLDVCVSAQMGDGSVIEISIIEIEPSPNPEMGNIILLY